MVADSGVDAVDFVRLQDNIASVVSKNRERGVTKIVICFHPSHEATLFLVNPFYFRFKLVEYKLACDVDRYPPQQNYFSFVHGTNLFATLGCSRPDPS